MHVSISSGNTKMGSIRSVSLPSVTTCRADCGCHEKCYARKLERIRPSVREAYARNYNILNTDPEQYWREVEAAIMTSRFFRFHVSGDIVSADYLDKMIELSMRNEHCQVLCFTKKYDIVNAKLGKMEENTEVWPDNLHIIYSGWRGLEMVNPYHMPEAHVRYKDGTTTAKGFAAECGGNCTECAKVTGGCWSLERGQQVIFNEH